MSWSTASLHRASTRDKPAGDPNTGGERPPRPPPVRGSDVSASGDSTLSRMRDCARTRKYQHFAGSISLALEHTGAGGERGFCCSLNDRGEAAAA
jgi:hypothetical protein